MVSKISYTAPEWIPITQAVEIADSLYMKPLFERAFKDGSFRQTDTFERGAIRIYADASKFTGKPWQPGDDVAKGEPILAEWCVDALLPEIFWPTKDQPRTWPVAPLVNHEDVISFLTFHFDTAPSDAERHKYTYENSVWTDLEALAWIASRDEVLVDKIRCLALNKDLSVAARRWQALRYLCWQIERAKPEWAPSFPWLIDSCAAVAEAFDNLYIELVEGKISAAVRSPDRKLKDAEPGEFTLARLDIAGSTMTLIEAAEVLFRATVVKEAWPGKSSAENQPQQPARRGRRKGDGSMADADAPLLDEMRKLIEEGKAYSPDGAAKIVANRAAGGGTVPSKATRLAKRYLASERKCE